MRKFIALNDESLLPKRSTQFSAGYDFYAAEDVSIYPNETKIIKTGVTLEVPENEYLGLYARSSLVVKKGLIMGNGVGIIDSDFSGNEISIILINTSDNLIRIAKHERIAQGIFHKYLVTDDDSEHEKAIRKGGIGSTGGYICQEKDNSKNELK